MTGRELSGTRSLGLLGMRERATILDGEVNIIGRQGKAPRWGCASRCNGPAELTHYAIKISWSSDPLARPVGTSARFA